MGVPVFSRNPLDMQDLGSGLAVCREVNSDGSLLDAAQQTAAGYGVGTPYEWLEMFIVKSSSMKDETTINKKVSEGGKKFPFAGERDVSIELVSMQRDDDLLESIIDHMRGKYFEIVKENSEVPLAKGIPYIHIPIAQVQPKLDYALPGGEPKLLFDILPVAVAIAARDLSAVPNMNAPFTGITSSVAVGKYYKRFYIVP